MSVGYVSVSSSLESTAAMDAATVEDDATTNNQNSQVEIHDLTNEEEESAGYGKRKRKHTSDVWNDFKLLPKLAANGNREVKCNHCHVKLVYHKSGNTTTMKRHRETCTMHKINLAGQRQLLVAPSLAGSQNQGSTSAPSLQSWKYDQGKVRQVISHMVMVHELPFAFAEYELFNLLMKTTYPEFKEVSRFTLRSDCDKSYEIEKKRTVNLLKSVSRVSITTDIWKSKHQRIEYMVMTCHFVSDFKLHKRVLSFVDIPSPHTGVAVCDALYKCLEKWGLENKLATITVDNASYNDTAVRLLKGNLEDQRTLPYLGGKIFHVRWCAHILNILVQHGMDEIGGIIANVRDSIRYITASAGRISIFSDIAKQLKCSSKKLILDCTTRWNAIYAMLSCALEFKKVFPRYGERDANFKTLPSEEDFEKAEKICKFLQLFDVVTNIISGTHYPTSNLFLPELRSIKALLDKEASGRDLYMAGVASKMKERFDKYWGESNLLISIAAILDPRVKLKAVEIIYKSLYFESDARDQLYMVRAQLTSIYQEYVDQHVSASMSENNGESSSTVNENVGNSSVHASMNPGLRDLQIQMEKDNFEHSFSDLDKYLEEGVYICKPEALGQFDVLGWWKANHLRFRILSKMACDILSIPITTAASESTFSAGGRVIDPQRASLGTDTVEMLMCGEDWLRNFYNIKRKKSGEDVELFNLP